MDIPQRILSHASSLFMRFGVRSITMDDIAKDLGISKKTIYQYYANKAEMVDAVCNNYFREEEAISEKITQESTDAIDEILRILTWSIETLESISPNLLLELEKYYPIAWKHVEQFQQEYLLLKIRQNLEWGIREGLYRQGLHTALVSQLRMNQIMSTLNPENFLHARFHPAEVQRVSVDLYLHSILTEKGLSVYHNRINYTNQP